MARIIRDTAYDPAWTLRQARAQYFRDNGFAEDGGYSDAWVKVQLGPLPIVFPNAPSRVRAVRFHDLNHVVTGYRTDNPGEFEISAFEVASGCRDFWAAWFLNLSAMAAGLYRCPHRTFRAFVRGRHTGNVYGADLDALLEETVGAVRARLGADVPTPAATARDALSFAGYMTFACVLSLVWLAPPAAAILALYALLH